MPYCSSGRFSHCLHQSSEPVNTFAWWFEQPGGQDSGQEKQQGIEPCIFLKIKDGNHHARDKIVRRKTFKFFSLAIEWYHQKQSWCVTISNDHRQMFMCYKVADDPGSTAAIDYNNTRSDEARYSLMRQIISVSVTVWPQGSLHINVIQLDNPPPDQS